MTGATNGAMTIVLLSIWIAVVVDAGDCGVAAAADFVVDSEMMAPPET